MRRILRTCHVVHTHHFTANLCSFDRTALGDNTTTAPHNVHARVQQCVVCINTAVDSCCSLHTGDAAPLVLAQCVALTPRIQRNTDFTGLGCMERKQAATPSDETFLVCKPRRVGNRQPKQLYAGGRVRRACMYTPTAPHNLPKR